MNGADVGAVRPFPNEVRAMESWRLVWRDGFAPVLSDRSLAALAVALETDDKRLTQGSTTTPPPLMCVQDWPVEAGCVFGFCGAIENGGFDGDSDSPASVGKVEEFFANACFQADQRLGEPAACRWFLNYWDNEPRDRMRAELLPEVKREIEKRKGVAA